MNGLYYDGNNSTGKQTGKTYLCAVVRIKYTLNWMANLKYKSWTDFILYSLRHRRYSKIGAPLFFKLQVICSRSHCAKCNFCIVKYIQYILVYKRACFFWKIDWHDIIVQEKKDEKRWKKWHIFLGLVKVIILYKYCC